MLTSAIHRLQRRILSLLAWGRTSLVDDSGTVQIMQVQHNLNEIGDGRPRVAEFGFSSNPPPGCDVVVAYLGGDRTNGIVIATNHQSFRFPGLNPGDTVLYDGNGNSILLNAEGITITSVGPLAINTPGIVMNGPLTTTGSLSVAGDITSSGSIGASGDITYGGGIMHG